MDYKQFLKEARELFKNGFDAFLEKQGLSPLHGYVASDFEVMDAPLTMALYPSSPKGETFAENGQKNTASLTIDLYVNSTATAEGVEELESYYSALIMFVQREAIKGIPMHIATSNLFRMDDGATDNGILMLIEIDISTFLDYGWY